MGLFNTPQIEKQAHRDKRLRSLIEPLKKRKHEVKSTQSFVQMLRFIYKILNKRFIHAAFAHSF